MKIIHVHVQDADHESSIITLLNLGFTIAVPIDRVDMLPAKPEVLLRADHKARDAYAAHRSEVKARIRAQRAEADAYIAERERRHQADVARDVERNRKAAARLLRDAANGNPDAQRIIDASQADRQAVYDARYAEASAARVVACPACAAAVNDPCTSPKGKAYGAFVHIDRIKAKQAAS